MANFPNEIDLRMFQPASPPKSPVKQIEKPAEKSSILRPKSGQPRIDQKSKNESDLIKLPPVPNKNEKSEEVTNEKMSTANEIIPHAHTFDSNNHAELSYAPNHVTSNQHVSTDVDKYLFTRLTIKVIH